jgi:outer membrane receptor protein involved in Fe transport
MNHWPLPALTCAITLFASSAQAQPAAPPQPAPAARDGSPTKQLDAVEIRSATDRDDRQASTAAKIVVTREDLDRFGDATVGEVLNRLPGVTVSGTPGRGGGEIRMRGLGAGYVSILINGEPAPPGFSVDSLSPSLIERIEVARVPTADKSAQAIAGAINIILKQAVRKGQRELKANLAEQWGRPSGGLNGQPSDRAGSVSYTLAGELRHEEYEQRQTIRRSATDAQGAPVSANVTDSWGEVQADIASLTPRLNWQADEHNRFSIDGLLYYQRFTYHTVDRIDTLFGPPPLLVRTERPAGIPRHVNNGRVRTSWLRQFEEGGDFELKLGAGQFLLRQPAIYHSFDAQDQFVRERSIIGRTSDRSWNINGKLRQPLQAGHTLTAGWDLERAQRNDGRTQRDVLPLGLLTPVNLDEDFQARIDRLALFAQDEWTVSPRWSLSSGLRWEQLQTHSTGGADFDSRSAVFSPSLQSLWKLPGTKADQVRVGLSRTYKAPSPRDLSPRRYVGGNENTPTSPDSEGNPALQPERAWGLDLAYERYLDNDAGLLSTSLYARRIQDVQLPELFYDTAQGLWITRPTNRGNATSYGIELEAKTSVRKLVRTAPAVDLRFNLGRNFSRLHAVPGPGNRLNQQTPLSLNTGADWRPDGVPLTIGGNFGLTTGGLVAIAAGQTGWTSVRRQLDVYGLWKQSPTAQWRLSLANLLRQDQLNDARYEDGNGSFNQSTMSRGAVNVRLGLEIKT